MNNMDYRDFAVNFVREAGKRLKAAQDKKIEISHKGEDTRDIVTNIDIEINDFFVSEINKKFPEHRIYSEEEEFSDAAA